MNKNLLDSICDTKNILVEAGNFGDLSKYGKATDGYRN